MAHPVTLLYSMSGAGKSSLINARLVPELEAEGCRVLPSARVRGSSWKLDPAQIHNIYVFNAMMSWQGHHDSETTAGLRARTFTDELAPDGKTAEEADALLIVVFDQFEEMFTTYSSRWRDRRGFFEQVSDALESIPNLRILLAMREDYVAGLDPYARLVPESLRTRFRLERLRREAALAAVIKPVSGTGRRFAPGIAERLVDSLMTIQIRPRDDVLHPPSDNVDSDILTGAAGLPSPSGEIPVFGPRSDDYVATSEYVEPVQLQVVCHNLWANLHPDELEITAAHLESGGDVNQALSGFYDDCVAETAQLTGLREGAIRRWFGERLITPAGTRGLVLRGPETTAELPNNAVELLEGRFLIRGEDRGGARWYELSHDRFIEPVRNSNRHWQSARPGQALWTELNQRAAAWESAAPADKPSFLLKKDELAAAEAWKASADAGELGISDRLLQLLDESHDAIDKAELAAQMEAQRKAASDKARKARMLMRVLSVVAVMLVLASTGWLMAIRQRKAAQDAAAMANLQKKYAQESEEYAKAEKDRAEVIRLAMEAQAEMRTNPRIALGKIPDLVKLIHQKGVKLESEERTADVLRNALSGLNHRTKLGPYTQEVNHIAFAPRRWGGRLRDGPARPVLAVGGRDGKLDLWDLGNQDNPERRHLVPSIVPSVPDSAESSRWVNRIVFDPAGRALAFCTGNTASVHPQDRGSAWIWIAPQGPGGEGTLRALVDGSDSGPIADIAFSPDGKTIATAGSRALAVTNEFASSGTWMGDVRIFQAESSKLLHSFKLDGPARSVAFDRLGGRLVAASGDSSGSDPNLPGQVVVYSLNQNDPERDRRVMEGYPHPSVRALFSADGVAVISGGVDGVARVHDSENCALIATLVGHEQQILDLSMSPDGTRLVTASGDRTARIWSIPPLAAARSGRARVWSSQVTLVGHKAWVRSAEFSPFGVLVLTGSYDRTARVWDAQTGECLVVQSGHQGTINAARFQASGYLMATAGADASADVWMTGNVQTPRIWLAARDALVGGGADERRAGEGHDAALRAVAFRPGREGRYEALTAGADGVACLWDVHDWDTPRFVQHPLRRFVSEPHSAPLSDAAFTPDGELVATAAVDGRVRVWKVDSGDLDKVIQAESGPDAGAALGVTFSPKGSYLLTSWADGRMRLYRRGGDDWKPVCDPWPGSAFHLAPKLFDNDERFVVTPNTGVLCVKGRVGSVRLWDVEKPDGSYKLLPPKGGLGPVADLAINPKTGEIAAATMGRSGSVVVFERDQGRFRPAGNPLPHPVGIERLLFNPAGTKLVTEDEYGMGRIWSWPLDEGKSRYEPLPGLTGPSPALAYSKGGDYLAADSGAAVGQIWDQSGKPLGRTFRHRDRVLALSFSAGPEPELLSINRENRFQKWSIPGGAPLDSATGPYPVPSAVAISPDGKLAVSGTSEGQLKVWSTESGVVIAESDSRAPSGAFIGRISSLAFSADGRSIASGDKGGVARVWTVPDLHEPKSESGPATIARLTARATLSPEPEGPPITAVRFWDEKGRTVIIGAGDLDRYRAQEAGAARAGPDFETKTQEFDAFAFVLDLTKPQATPEKVLAATKLTRGSLPADSPAGALTAAVSRSDARILVGCGGQETTTSNVVQSIIPHAPLSGSDRYLGHSEAVLDVAVSPDGRWLATASADNTARIWTIPVNQSTKPVELRGHSGDVSFVTFSPDGQFILTISRQDGTARIWDRDGCDAFYVFGTGRAGFNSATLNDSAGPRQYTDDVVAAAFSLDGKLVATAHGDGSARVYRLDLCGGLDDLSKVAQRRLNGVKD
jgi:WD40 repeat protein